MQIKPYPKDNRYKIYSDGNILGPGGKFLTPLVTKKGYHQCRINNKTITWHRVICETFLSPITDKPHINHKNGIKTDNRLNNLEWISNTMNMRHAFANGLISRVGDKNSKCKIPSTYIPIIKEAICNGFTVKDIAGYFNVRYQTIHKIKTGINWSHI